MYNTVMDYFNNIDADTSRNYKDDILKNSYDDVASKIENFTDALYYIIANALVGNYHINAFDFNINYYKNIKRYSNNKFTICTDFAELCTKENIKNNTESGKLATDVLIDKNNYVLMAYLESVKPLISDSLSNYIKSTPIQLEYVEDSKKEELEYEYEIFKKLSSFLIIIDADREYIEKSINISLEFNIINNDNNMPDLLHNVTYY